MNNEDKKNLKKLLIMYLTSRLGLIILMIVCSFIIHHTNPFYDNIFLLFDNQHYLNIAILGYKKKFEYAFFPFVPLLIRYLGKIPFLIINQLCTFGTGFLLYKLSKKYFNKKNPLFASLLWFLSPIGIFTMMFYTEAIFIFLTILAYYLYKEKKHYLLLGIILGLSVCTRSFGALLFFTIFIFMTINVVKKNEKFKNILITFFSATILSCLYPIFLYTKTKNFLYFTKVQFDYWERTNTNIFTIFFDSIKYLVQEPLFLYVINFILTFSLIGFIIYKIIKNRKDKIYWDMYLYTILTILLMTSTIRNYADSTTSFYRYMFACFPIYFFFKNKYMSIYIITGLTFVISLIYLCGFYFF